MRPRTSLSAAALAAAFALTACGGGSGSSGDTAGGQPQRGGTLRFAISVDSGCVDPQQVGNNDALNVGRQLVDSLTVQDPASGEVEPWLAQSWEVSPDATTFTFHLRQGVTFSDGAPLDAAAVQRNLDGIVALGAKASLGSTYLSGYTGTEVVDASTAVVRFSRPSAQFLQATSTMSLGLLSPASVAADPATRCDGTTLVGSGPFTVTSYAPDSEIRLARRTGYAWAPTGSANQGESHLDGIVFQVVPEASVRTGSLASDQIDATTGIGAQDLPQFDRDGFRTERRANPGVPYNFFPNTSRPLFSDVRVRQALSKAVDRQEIAASVLNPGDVAVTSALSASTPLAPDDADLLAHDPDGARALLDAAGWVPGADGIRAKGGQRLTFTVTYWQTAPGLELVQQQLREVGIDLQLKATTVAETNAVQDSGDYDVLFYNLTRADPDVLRTLFALSGRDQAHRGTAGPVDAALDGQAATLDPAQRTALVAQAGDELLTQGYSVPLWELSTVLASSEDVHDLQFEASSRLWFHDAWLSRD